MCMIGNEAVNKNEFKAVPPPNWRRNKDSGQHIQDSRICCPLFCLGKPLSLPTEAPGKKESVSNGERNGLLTASYQRKKITIRTAAAHLRSVG